MAEALGVTRRRTITGSVVALLGAAAWIASFIATLDAFDGMDTNSTLPPLFLGIPVATAGVVVFTLVIGAGVVIASTRADAASDRRPLAGLLLLVAGGVGLLAAWALTADKVVTLTEPGTHLECNFSLLVQCGANLASWQGSLLGFPNPLLGLAGWSAVIVVAVSVLLGIRLPTAFWTIFTVGVVGALALVIWLISQSILVLATLCPWCMVTWSVTIPLFWYTAAEFMQRLRSPIATEIGRAAKGWLPLLTVLSYLAVAIIAQVRLDVIAYL